MSEKTDSSLLCYLLEKGRNDPHASCLRDLLVTVFELYKSGKPIQEGVPVYVKNVETTAESIELLAGSDPADTKLLAGVTSGEDVEPELDDLGYQA